MQVIVRDEFGADLWARARGGDDQPFGMACSAYGSDGTQKQIVAALTEALHQAEAELRLYEADAMPDSGAGTAEVKDDVPVP